MNKAYKYKLKPNSYQKALMVNWLNMLRGHYNFCLRDRIDSYEQVKQPKLGNYSDLRTKAQCCPLTCSVSKNSQLGEPFKGDKKRNAYEMQSSELPRQLSTSTVTEQKHYQPCNIRAYELGYDVKKVSNGTNLGRFVKKLVTPAFKDYQGQYSVWHYEVNNELDNAIHSYFRNDLISVK